MCQPLIKKVILGNDLVGATGFEPATSRPPDGRAKPGCATPRF